MTRRHLIIDPRDNVSTLLDEQIDDASLDGGGAISPGTPFGHKVAIRPIARGEAVIKYGIAIGIATTDIPAGTHVHIHNCR